MTTKAPKDFNTLKNPDNYMFQFVDCYHCHSKEFTPFIVGQDDLTGKEGNFRFVQCNDCGLIYQNPRIHPDQIKNFYDEEYIAHRKKNDYGIITPLYEWAMSKHDREKEKLVKKYVKLDSQKEVLDVGCAVGTFLTRLNKIYSTPVTGVDFKDLSHYPGAEMIDFKCGFFQDQNFGDKKFDLITMWHFLEHCYSPYDSLAKAKEVLKAKTGRLVIEVPRLDSVSFHLFKERWPGLQAPQHTVIFDKTKILEFVKKAGFEVIDYLPYGAFPAYFYLYSGFIFKFLKGKGVNLDKHMAPYFLGQLLLTPALLFEKQLNLSMQTVVCSIKE